MTTSRARYSSVNSRVKNHSNPRSRPPYSAPMARTLSSITVATLSTITVSSTMS